LTEAFLYLNYVGFSYALNLEAFVLEDVRPLLGLSAEALQTKYGECFEEQTLIWIHQNQDNPLHNSPHVVVFPYFLVH